MYYFYLYFKKKKINVNNKPINNSYNFLLYDEKKKLIPTSNQFRDDVAILT